MLSGKDSAKSIKKHMMIISKHLPELMRGFLPLDREDRMRIPVEENFLILMKHGKYWKTVKSAWSSL